jgi:hypothetical protein
MNLDIPFGGKKFLIGGDLRQILPVVVRGSRADIINASIVSSYLWSHVRRLKLKLNMRLQNSDSAAYKEFLMRIGNGTQQSYTIDEIDDYIKLPNNIWLPSNKQNLFDSIYDDFVNRFSEIDYINSRAILCPLNADTDDINDLATRLLPGETRSYFSIDSILHNSGDCQNIFPVELLNTLKLSGLPSHELKLKINQPIILMRNICPSKGLCNGSRMIIKSLQLIKLIYFFIFITV